MSKRKLTYPKICNGLPEHILGRLSLESENRKALIKDCEPVILDINYDPMPDEDKLAIKLRNIRVKRKHKIFGIEAYTSNWIIRNIKI